MDLDSVEGRRLLVIKHFRSDQRSGGSPRERVQDVMGTKARRARYRDSLSRVPSIEDLLAAILHLVESLGLVGAVTYGRRGTKIATIEACAHEISHWVFTGPTFESRLVNMSSRAANRHEASALRVEVAVLDRLGCKVSMHTLWARANWNDDYGNKRPSWASMGLPLTPREDRCVRTMIRRVQDALDAVSTAERPLDH